MPTTWDGLPIAEDDPNGCTVVVRRPGLEYLLLHRAHEGPDFDGDWAWTSPAGARHPGEPVLAAAYRELAEEAGITGVELWPVDLSGGWAVFCADVSAETPVELIDPEHDKYEWVSFETAATRVLPKHIAEGNFRAVTGAVRERFGFRPMRYDDLPELVRWRQAPHAARWFDGPADLAEAEDRFGARIAGETAHRMFTVELDDEPVGYFFHFLVNAYPDYLAEVGDAEAAGVDFALGRPDLCGRGVGPQLIWRYVREIVLAEHPDLPRVISSPPAAHRQAVRALEKAGFTLGPELGGLAERLCTFDVGRIVGSVPVHR